MLLAVAQYYCTAHCILILCIHDICCLTESLNTDMVKSENPDAVVATEPQGKHIFTALYLYLLYFFSVISLQWSMLT